MVSTSYRAVACKGLMESLIITLSCEQAANEKSRAVKEGAEAEWGQQVEG